MTDTEEPEETPPQAQPPAHSYGTRDVQPGYETPGPPRRRPDDESPRYDSPRDPRDPDSWGADES